MAGNKYLALVSGVIKEVFGVQTSSGVSDANKIPALDSTGKLDITLMPVGVTAEALTILASENLSAGDLVNFYSNAGTLNVRRADASSNAKFANGFVLSAVTSGQNATVYLEGLNTAVSGLTVGAEYWLSSTTPGGLVGVGALPATANYIIQPIGTANSASSIYFNRRNTIELS